MSKKIIFVIFVLGMCLSFGSARLLHDFEKDALKLEFESDVNQRVLLLQRELSLNLELSSGLAILFRNGQAPSYKAFAYEANLLLKKHKSIFALSWEPRVMYAQRSDFEKNNHLTIKEKNKFNHLAIAEQRAQYFPLQYIVPFIGNENMLGFDISSKPTRLKTLILAQNSGLAHATGVITLLFEKKNKISFISDIPVYKKDSKNESERKENLLGFISAVFKGSDIFKYSALSDNPLGIDMRLRDITDNQRPELLHYHRSRDNSVMRSDLSYRVILDDVLGRKWEMTAIATEEYVQNRKSYLSLLLFLLSVTVTFSISGYLLFSLNQAAVIKRLIAEKTKHLNIANKKLAKLSLIDPLTEIFNRRKMDIYLLDEWNRAMRSAGFISFLILDIDFFKDYNDNYGHQAGDDALKQVAQKLKKVVRRTGDLVVRYGGEEFAIIMPNSKDAKTIAKHCLQGILDLKIEHKYSKVHNILTISIGCCCLEVNRDTSIEELIKSADNALYLAKDAGRNCIR